VEECERRDVKGLYQRARAGQIQGFTGVSDPYEEPLSPELLLDTETETVEQSVEKLIGFVEERLAGAQPAAAAST
jgi:adenylylsulfate kinase